MDTLNWSYRPMTLEDMPILLDWYNNRELHEMANAKAFKPYTLGELTEYWREKLGRDHAKYFAILLEGRLVGRVGLKGKKDGTVEFSILIADLTLHSRGLGTAITKRMLVEAFAEPSVACVLLHVRQDNERAIRCYEKSGYRFAGSFVENGVPMHLMQVERCHYEAN